MRYNPPLLQERADTIPKSGRTADQPVGVCELTRERKHVRGRDAPLLAGQAQAKCRGRVIRLEFAIADGLLPRRDRMLDVDAPFAADRRKGARNAERRRKPDAADEADQRSRFI